MSQKEQGGDRRVEPKGTCCVIWARRSCWLAKPELFPAPLHTHTCFICARGMAGLYQTYSWCWHWLSGLRVKVEEHGQKKLVLKAVRKEAVQGLEIVREKKNTYGFQGCGIAVPPCNSLGSKCTCGRDPLFWVSWAGRARGEAMGLDWAEACQGKLCWHKCKDHLWGEQ